MTSAGEGAGVGGGGAAVVEQQPHGSPAHTPPIHLLLLLLILFPHPKVPLPFSAQLALFEQQAHSGRCVLLSGTGSVSECSIGGSLGLVAHPSNPRPLEGRLHLTPGHPFDEVKKKQRGKEAKNWASVTIFRFFSAKKLTLDHAKVDIFPPDRDCQPPSWLLL